MPTRYALFEYGGQVTMVAENCRPWGKRVSDWYVLADEAEAELASLEKERTEILAGEKWEI